MWRLAPRAPREVLGDWRLERLGDSEGEGEEREKEKGREKESGREWKMDKGRGERGGGRE